ncbi:MAG: hypothetical protein HY706_04625 [Candidatus Hydrogenedentes bacterium]|nr:hypothetical protein [Candidatus Hydrogenedentota bacterium]
MLSRVGLVILLLAAVTVLLVIGAKVSSSGLSAEAITQRVLASHPTWQSYDEDIKAQIGAAPVAEWQGQPVAAQCDTETVRVTFRLTGPWAVRKTAIPVLLRDPLSGTHQNARTERKNGMATYVFEMPKSATSAGMAWIEIKYPRGERRLILSPTGEWEAD